jgi:hypothetical protein
VKQRSTTLFAAGLLTLTLFGIATAGPLEDGNAAAQRGDYAAAIRVADILINRDVPFIFVTGYNAIPNGQYRNIPILQKPFGLEALESALEKTLRRK